MRLMPAPCERRRLHQIQALRKFSMALADIGAYLASPEASPLSIVVRQIGLLDRQIDEAARMRATLLALHAQLANGEAPELATRLTTLEQMIMYEKYFKFSDTIPPYPIRRGAYIVSHTAKEKTKLLNRVRRIRGQIEAVERALEAETECSEILHLLAATRGGLNGLMAEVIEDHIREHVASPEIESAAERMKGADELVEIVRTYLK
jgi:DNA-binding FrmR family transcriptional regulator